MKKYLSTRLERQIEGKNIDFLNLSDHPDLTIELIRKFPYENWDWESIQIHPNMNLEWLISFPEAPWVWSTMHYTKAFKPYWLCLFAHKPWDWRHLHQDENFDFSWVEQSPNPNWNWDKLSEMVTIEQLNKWPKFPWCWDIITAYSQITADEMMKNLHHPWDVSVIRFNNITMEEIPFIRHFQKKFDHVVWADFTLHSEWKAIKTNADLPWVPQVFRFKPEEFEDSDINFLRRYNNLNWMTLSMNVPFRVIKNNLDLPWIFEWMSLNKTVTYKDVETFSDRNWDYSVVPCKPKEQCLLEWISASKIKRAWRIAITNPKYVMCRKRLDSEFKLLVEFNNVKTR